MSTHRPGVLKLCQRIYRIQDGGIRELGSDEIMNLTHMDLDYSQSEDVHSEDMNREAGQWMGRFMLQNAELQSDIQAEDQEDMYLNGEKNLWDY